MPQVASMGAAVSIVDADRDGHADVYVTNSREGSKNRFYRNRGDGTFEDVTGRAGVPGRGYGMGCAVGDFDEEAEYALLLEDLRETIPGFDERARILSRVTTRDGWPPQRAVAGFDMSHDTPLTGLWNVGDAVKEYANGGTTACAETAEIVVGKITSQFSPS